ncbi:MAG: hypothetical protein AAFP20_13550 [Cyanobacteria bacterium J06614_10]
MTSNFNAHSQPTSSLSPQEIEFAPLISNAYGEYSENISPSVCTHGEQTYTTALEPTLDAANLAPATIALTPKVGCPPKVDTRERSLSSNERQFKADESDLQGRNLSGNDLSTSSEGVAYTPDEKFVLLSAFLDDEVTEQERALVIGWINSDPQLQRQYQEQMKLREAMKSIASKSGWGL